jgi:hypothetical protein
MGSSVFDNTTRWTPSFSVGNNLEMSQKSAAMLEFFIFFNAMEFYFLSVKNSVSKGPTDVQFIMSVHHNNNNIAFCPKQVRVG